MLNIEMANSRSRSRSPRRHNYKDYLEEDEYFMTIALVAAKRSVDPITRVGACIVNGDNKIVGVGYNSMPHGKEDKFTWKKNKNGELDDKRTFVCHAELNAIMNSNSADVKNCTIYVTRHPCNECAKIIAQSAIKDVVYIASSKEKCLEYAAQKIFTETNIQFRTFRGNNKEVKITLP